MPLLVSSLPREAERVLESDLPIELLLQDISDDTELESVTLAFPHRVFELSTLDLADGGWTERSRLIGWDVLLLEGDRPLHTIHLRVIHDGLFELAGISPYSAESIVKRLRAVERYRQTSSNVFDLSKLIAPMLGLSAIWCRSRGVDADCFASIDHLTKRSRIDKDRKLAFTWRIAACRNLLDRAQQLSESR